MTEYFSQPPFEGEHKTDESPRFDPVIDEALLKISRTDLSRKGSESIDRLATRDEKVDMACWLLAQRPETVPKAVNLRSMYAIRSMDVATRNLDASESWDYHVAVLHDRFWSDVDKAMYAHLRKSADKMHHESSIHEQIIGQWNDIAYTEQNIAEMNDRIVSRRTFRNIHSDSPHHVVYSVLPEIDN